MPKFKPGVEAGHAELPGPDVKLPSIWPLTSRRQLFKWKGGVLRKEGSDCGQECQAKKTALDIIVWEERTQF